MIWFAEHVAIGAVGLVQQMVIGRIVLRQCSKIALFAGMRLMDITLRTINTSDDSCLYFRNKRIVDPRLSSQRAGLGLPAVRLSRSEVLYV